jgi:tetratricopeptide (TPR) repeat protein
MDNFMTSINSNLNDMDLKFDQINQYLQNSDYENAKICLREILETEPENPSANFMMAQIFEFEENFVESANYYKKTYHTELPDEFKDRIAEVFEKADEYELAYQVYKDLYQKNSTDKFNCEKLADICIIIGKKNEAIEIYNKILTIEPDDIVALNQLADLYENTNTLLFYLTKARINEIENTFSYASENYKKALSEAEKTEDIIQIRYKLAQTYVKRDKNPAAIDEYLRILEIDDKNFSVHKALADIYIEMDNTEAAIEVYQRALDIYPDDPDVLRDLSDLYFEEEYFEKSLELLSRLIQIDPDDEDNKLSIAKCHIALNNHEDAEELLEKLDAENSDSTEIMAICADYFLLKNDFKKALEFTQKIRKKLPNSPFSYRKSAEIFGKIDDKFNYHYNYGIYHQLKGERTLAIDEYTWALEINREHIDTFTRLASLYEDTDEKYIAIDYYQKAFQSDPSFIQALKKIGQIYSKTKDYETAHKYFEEYIEKNPSDNEIYYINAECLYKIKDYEKALENYKIYRDKGIVSTVDEEVQNRISELESKLKPVEDEGLLSKIFGFLNSGK